MIKLDHLSISVADHERSRDWYCRHFGFKVEFEVPQRDTVGPFQATLPRAYRQSEFNSVSA